MSFPPLHYRVPNSQGFRPDRALYKKRNEIERLFRRLKLFRRIFSSFEKLDVLFLAFLYFALIVEALRLVGTALVPCWQFRSEQWCIDSGAAEANCARRSAR